MRRHKKGLVPIALLFLVLAAALSVTIWPDVSPAAKIAFFCFGFASGAAAGGQIALRRHGISENRAP
ncbi:hypothetical protein H8D73_00455 [bacterium]|nr:hypothetical protein [bacterium]